MSERPLNDKEKLDLRKRLDDARKRYEQLGDYIAELEADLQRGTAWGYESGAFGKMCREVEESAGKDREEDEKQEISRYGRILTHEEHRGWVRLPPGLLSTSS